MKKTFVALFSVILLLCQQTYTRAADVPEIVGSDITYKKQEVRFRIAMRHIIPRLERKLRISFGGNHPRIETVSTYEKDNIFPMGAIAIYDSVAKTIVMGSPIEKCNPLVAFAQPTRSIFFRPANELCTQEKMLHVISHEIGHHYIATQTAIKKKSDAMFDDNETARLRFIDTYLTDRLVEEGIAEHFGRALTRAKLEKAEFEGHPAENVELSFNNVFGVWLYLHLIQGYAADNGEQLIGPVLSVDFHKGIACLTAHPLSLPLHEKKLNAMNVRSVLHTYQREMARCATR